MRQQDTLVNGARLLIREAIREPVREAVREALQEEAVAVRADEGSSDRLTASDEDYRADEYDSDEEDSDKGGSAGGKLGFAVLGLVGVLGLTYVFRKRRGSDESQDVAADRYDATAQSGGYGTETTTGDYDEMGTAGDEAGAESTPPGDQ